ncbi:MAG: LysR family transcriptional regulator [Alcanivoracaceae bacterium]|nr:LysR family transcriptional regulator [Alcanivoracaceae bacterium]
MRDANISRIDLNLFVVFDAIVREGSISAAARSLNLTQPAVSHALARLRDRLDDELFVRRGRQMAPTAKARSLIGPVREALTGLQACLSSEPGFDPASARRTFVLGLRDGLEACVLPPLMRKLLTDAPAIEVQSLTVARRDTLRELAAGRLDLAMDVQLPVSGNICQQPLVESPLVVLMRHGHLLAGKAMTLTDYLSAGHVLVSSRRRGPGLEDFGLAQAGHQRAITLRCQHYQAAMEVVAATDLMLTLPAVLAEQLAGEQFVSAALPLQMPPMAMHLYWHRDLDGDPGHRWLRALLLAGRV